MVNYWKLADVVTNAKLADEEQPWLVKTGLSDYLEYNHGRVNPSLEQAIIKLHSTINNAETSGYKIIVGAGASQVVSAVGYAAAKMNFEQIQMVPPFWGRLEILLNLGASAGGFIGNILKKAERSQAYFAKGFTFVTSPNNPDGTINSPDPSFKVVDMCYNWPQYTSGVEKGKHDVMIFGLSKATGHAGTRVGWALVKDQTVFNFMKEYIEISSCGVSDDAQIRAAKVIEFILSPKEDAAIMSSFDYATSVLIERWAKFSAQTKKNQDFKVLNRIGMFAWCQYTGPELSNMSYPDGTPYRAAEYIKEKYGLIVTPGQNLGLDFNSNCFRINLGCSDENFGKMMKALQNGN
jgi:L-tryptophan--pyruvate aminotransferase